MKEQYRVRTMWETKIYRASYLVKVDEVGNDITTPEIIDYEFQETIDDGEISEVSAREFTRRYPSKEAQVEDLIIATEDRDENI